MEIKVKTIFSYKNRRPYMAYDVETDEYSLVMNPIKDMRNIKELMKKVKADIKNKNKIINGINPVVNFQIANFRYM